jgi:UDP-2,3-diacylglucosamine hydrolase
VKRLFLSDLHLDDPQSTHFGAFRRLLETAATAIDEVYLLGDLCEVWVGDDDDGPLAQGLRQILSDTAARCAVRIMRGNRDFLFGSRLEADTGVQLIADPYRLDADTLLSHGDAFCVDDQAYQDARRMLRSTDWQREVLSRPLDARRALAATMRQQSREHNANRADNIMDVNAAEVGRVMAEHAVGRLIHGHTHRPGIHRWPGGARYVLGAWERCGWALLEDRAGAMHLRCFALDADPAPVIR